MKFTVAFAAAVASALVATASADYPYPDVANAFAGYNLVFQDEFNAAALNESQWTPDWDCSGWGNNMRAAYTTSPKNLNLTAGNLVITPICGRLQPNKSICQPFTGYPECACEPTNANKMDATSAQISTRHKFAFNKGKFRLRAKMSTGYYTWPAFWLYRDWNKDTQTIPESGEIDIMEGVGKRPQWWTAVIHYMTKDANGNWTDKVRNKNADWKDNLNETFHVYGLDWTDGTMKWTIDEEEMWTLDYGKLMADPNNLNVFDDGFYHIILDVAVGGRMFGIGYGNNKPAYDELCADAPFTSTLIDWVRVYQETGKNNFTRSASGPALVKGSSAGIVSQGAANLFGGAVGSTWNDRVDALTKTASGGATATTGAAAPTGSSSAAGGGAATTAGGSASTTTTSKLSGAAGAGVHAMSFAVAALVGAVASVFVALV